MRPRDRQRVIALVAASTLLACASVDPRPDFDEARARIRAATGVDSVFDPQLPVMTEAETLAVLAAGLTLDEALGLALQNNRHLQAGFLELGVGRAEYVQAGLLENPTLSLAFLFPSGGGDPKITGDLVQSLADVWALPRRQEVARLGQEHRLLELSRFAGELVVNTKAAYFDSVAAREVRAVGLESLQIARSVLEKVRRQVESGVATRTDESLAEGLALDADLNYRLLEREENVGQRRLGALLSLDQDLSGIELIDALPDDVLPGTTNEAIVALSQRTRLDVRAAALAVTAAEAEVALEHSRAVPAASVGVAGERPESGSSTDFLGGVTGSIEVPVFDQNQAQVSRAEYRRDALKKSLEALTAEVAQEVRAALDRAEVTSRTAQFVERELLPRAELAASLAERAYALGDTTMLALLASQRRVLQARQDLIEARAEAARSRVELERRMGAPFEVLMRADGARPEKPVR